MWYVNARDKGFLFLDLTVHGSCAGVALSENLMNLMNQLFKHSLEIFEVNLWRRSWTAL